MLAISGGRLICMSTPWGQRGWFYEAWTSEEPWERTRVTAPECPRLSQTFLDEERRTLGRQWFAQEYMAEFAGASDQAFEAELVRAAFDVNVQPLFNAEEMIHFNHSPDFFSTRRQVMTLRHPTTGRVITGRQNVVRRNVIRRGSGLDTRSRSNSSNEYAIGLDLAQVRDYSAIAIIEKVLPPQPDALSSTSLNEPEYHVRHVARFDLGTPYPVIVSRVGEMMQHWKLRDRTRLVLDRTGVGAPVADMFLHAGLQPTPITITSGQRVQFVGRTVCVPRSYLISTLQILLQTGRLKIAPALEFAPILERELINFSVRRPAAADESLPLWRENDHDDLVFALAMACFYFERLARRSTPAVRVVCS